MSTPNPRQSFHKLRTWVIKVGSSIFVDETGAIRTSIFDQLSTEIHALTTRGRRVVLVSSGAIACGMAKLGLQKKPIPIPEKQAVSAVGQITLMNRYEQAFSKRDLNIAQILLTRQDLAAHDRYINVRHAIERLFDFGIIPIVNENDTVAVDEIKIGDNDNLSALVANIVEADILVILTDQEGLYTADPRRHKDASVISIVEDLNASHFSLAEDTTRPGSTGGMVTKLEAAQKASRVGIPTLIASGHRAGVLNEILEGKNTGTLILPQLAPHRLNRRKHWIAYTLKALGKINVDSGARQSILKQGKSLLPSGILKVSGHFERGEPVDLVTETEEKPFARGLTSYSSAEIDKIRGKSSAAIEETLGYHYIDEVIHRDDLVLLEE